MAPRKPSTSTTNKTKQPPLYRTPIPGGSATWFKKSELPVIRQRELDIIGTRLAPVFKKIALTDMAASLVKSPAAATVAVETAPATESDSVYDGSAIIGDSGITLDEAMELSGVLTDEDARLLYRLNDLCIWAYLKDWTLKKDGQPRPLPTDVDEVLELEPKLYDALQKHAAKLYNMQDPGSAFEVDPGVENPASPTGDSDA